MSQRLISRLSSFSQSHLPDIRKIHHVKSYLEDDGKNHSLEYIMTAPKMFKRQHF